MLVIYQTGAPGRDRTCDRRMRRTPDTGVHAIYLRQRHHASLTSHLQQPWQMSFRTTFDARPWLGSVVQRGRTVRTPPFRVRFQSRRSSSTTWSGRCPVSCRGGFSRLSGWPRQVRCAPSRLATPLPARLLG
jgi:hypothetical protein